MKNVLGIVLLAVVVLSACKKDYACTAKYGTEEKVFSCQNCSSSEVDGYKEKLKGRGWSEVNCEKD